MRRIATYCPADERKGRFHTGAFLWPGVNRPRLVAAERMIRG